MRGPLVDDVLEQVGHTTVDFGATGVRHDLSGPVTALRTDDELGVTYVASGDSLKVLHHSDLNGGASHLANLAVTHLDLAANGDVLANDGLNVVRTPRRSDRVQNLFMIPHTEPGRRVCRAQITSLVVSSDGAVWVTAGPS